MRWLVMAGGVVGTVVAWRLVAGRVASVWWTMAAVMGAAGLLAVALGDPAWSARRPGITAAAVGAGTGVALFAATRAFVAVVGRWPAFARHTAAVYDQRGGLPLGVALAVASVLVAPGEELFWRGLVQPEVARETSPLAGAALTWAAYVATNAASGSLPIVAAAAVGGASWGALAWWTGGVGGPLLCHVLWTGLMIALPPKAATA